MPQNDDEQQAAAIGSNASAQAGTDSASPLNDEFDKIVMASLKEWNVPGVAIAIVDHDNVYSKGYGFASLPDVPATPDTLWYAGSATKTQTGATLAHLIDTKASPSLLNGWQTPISSILPDDFVVQNEWATQHLTLEDAACHRTGIGRHDMAILRDRDGKPATLRDQVRNLRHFRFTNEPRVQCEYSNLPWLALSYVIEKLAGKPLGEVIKKTVWDPLGMKSTYFDTDDAIAAPEHLSSGYAWDKDSERFNKLEQTTVREASGAGAMITSVNDLAKWLKCLLSESEPFSKAVHADIQLPRAMYRPVPGMGKDIVTYGIGVTRTVYRGQVYFEHGGTTEGHSADVIWLPGLKLGLVLMSNAAPTGNFMGATLARKIIDDKLGIPTKDRIDMNAYYHKVYDQMSGLKSELAVLVGRAEPPLPLPIDIGNYAGTYHDAGYGKIVLKEEAAPDKPEERILVARRLDVWFQHRLELHHVSGDWWVCFFRLLNNPGISVALPVDFRIGVDGKVSAMNIDFKNDMVGLDDGPVLFRRID
ncbi:hypothetical protein QQS21_000796 [Conoideocrella luteorostrata]|uniref:Beta-lactamase-related domain-containing protein n=1 Tax=Conoideocrella luteorostrata TaxID=1105319 RepID=A0AAJ0D0R7_9HYPO|nr:hypothetical protein QQS21_000796 [Conoideocrella luteorostrata]